MHAITAGVADEGLRDPGDRARGAGMSSRRRRRPSPSPRSRATPSASATNIRTGNLGSAPVIVALDHRRRRVLLHGENFFTPVNFSNLIGQMAGTCMLAYGVVFVLLIGEIDLSIGYVSGIAGMIAALLQQPDSDRAGSSRLAVHRDRARLHDDHRRLPGLVRRADRRAVVRRHARRAPDLAGRDPAGTAGRDRDPGQHDQQRLRLLLQRPGRLDHRDHRQRRLRRGNARGRALGRRHGIPIRDPVLLVAQAASSSRDHAPHRLTSATRTAASRSRCCSSS